MIGRLAPAVKLELLEALVCTFTDILLSQIVNLGQQQQAPQEGSEGGGGGIGVKRSVVSEMAALALQREVSSSSCSLSKIRILHIVYFFRRCFFLISSHPHHAPFLSLHTH